MYLYYEKLLYSWMQYKTLDSRNLAGCTLPAANFLTLWSLYQLRIVLHLLPPGWIPGCCLRPPVLIHQILQAMHGNPVFSGRSRGLHFHVATCVPDEPTACNHPPSVFVIMIDSEKESFPVTLCNYILHWYAVPGCKFFFAPLHYIAHSSHFKA